MAGCLLGARRRQLCTEQTHWAPSCGKADGRQPLSCGWKHQLQLSAPRPFLPCCGVCKGGGSGGMGHNALSGFSLHRPWPWAAHPRTGPASDLVVPLWLARYEVLLVLHL